MERLSLEDLRTTDDEFENYCSFTSVLFPPREIANEGTTDRLVR